MTDILAWTRRAFGPAQAKVYAQTLALTLESLLQGPDVAGARTRDDILLGVRVLHVARRGRAGRHFVVFRLGGERDIDVLRVLHDSMDLARHVGAKSDSTDANG